MEISAAVASIDLPKTKPLLSAVILLIPVIDVLAVIAIVFAFFSASSTAFLSASFFAVMSFSSANEIPWIV